MMLDYYLALEQILKTVKQKSKVIELPLLDSVGKVLAKEIYASYNSPLFDNSAMDGYALGDGLDVVDQWKIVGRIIAGQNVAPFSLKKGEAIRIFTGTAIPTGCTTVVKQEDTVCDGNLLNLKVKPSLGKNIRYCAEELKIGDKILSAEQKLTPLSIAIAATQGFAQLPVFQPLRITVFSTGNELLEPGEPLTAGKIYNSNRYLLLSWLSQAGYVVKDGGILPDQLAITQQMIASATQDSDVILTTGGVSVGEEDHVRHAVSELGKINLWKIAMKPGKPFAWGEIGEVVLFMLPGNPMASMVGLHQLVLPALRRMSGFSIANAEPYRLQVKADFELQRQQSRREFMRGVLFCDQGQNWVKPITRQGSAMISASHETNALIDIAPMADIHKGDLLSVYPIDYKAG